MRILSRRQAERLSRSSNSPLNSKNMSNKTYQDRLYLTRKQETTLTRWLALCCEIFNAALPFSPMGPRLRIPAFSGKKKRTWPGLSANGTKPPKNQQHAQSCINASPACTNAQKTVVHSLR